MRANIIKKNRKKINTAHVRVKSKMVGFGFF